MLDEPLVTRKSIHEGSPVHVGTKRFSCAGAQPPFDHPHVYLEMGRETTVTCPYCSATYVYDPSPSKEDSGTDHLPNESR